jgi:polyvinyl alcohol dehydrogenase (cytochrome)
MGRRRTMLGGVRVSTAAFVTVGVAIALATGSVRAQPVSAGEALFQSRCVGCHEPAVERAPSRAELAQRSPAQIVDALTRGVMTPMAQGLSPSNIETLATYLATPPQGPAASRMLFAPKTTEVMCSTHPPIVAAPGPWSGWGVDEKNTRFQRLPGLKATDVPKLKLRWAFSYAGGVYGQPTVVGDYLFITSRGGTFYALDPSSGCVRWKTENLVARTAPVVIHSGASPSGWTVFVGETARVVRAYDATTGMELWRSEALDDHPSAHITGSPTYFQGRLYVPLSSGEEGAGALPTYPCCSFRGSLVALDALTGKMQWKQHVINEPLGPIRVNARGVQLQGPAGGGIWPAPTIDAEHGLVLVGTGNSYIDAPTTGTDAIIAFDLITGEERWRNQVTQHDDYVVACNRVDRPINCSADSGPDFDFGSPPIVMRTKAGKEIVLAGQKSGIVYGLEPTTGKVLWTTRVGSGTSLGGIEWGMAADDKLLYVPNSDVLSLMDLQSRNAGKPMLSETFHQVYGTPRPGLTALDPDTGRVIWHVDAQKSPCQWYGDRSGDRIVGCFQAHSAAATVIPGVLFSGTTDGWFRAYGTQTGKVLWTFNTTAQTYNTVNGVKGQPGGSIDGMGPTVANGMVFTMAGYNGSANTGGNGTNVLLAFSVGAK